ncbi:hypothetical protein chiPu_0014108 [Chiloscyllium punctatum]|uniref:Uncharacterized protein n=1 Tax=Chiloscyllium punctatum TaxID=137246 RepID=A0A401SYZ1_CHIPU|nr:hypothetical protein [Chiloscyllium punctatum]
MNILARSQTQLQDIQNQQLRQLRAIHRKSFSKDNATIGKAVISSGDKIVSTFLPKSTESTSKVHHYPNTLSLRNP